MNVWRNIIHGICLKMTPEIIIKTVCEVLKLDKSIMIDRASNINEPTPQSRDYCEGRYISTRLIRKHFEIKNKPTILYKKSICSVSYEEIGTKLGFLSGAKVSAFCCDRTCGNLLDTKDKSFTKKYVDCEVAVLKIAASEIPDSNFSRK